MGHNGDVAHLDCVCGANGAARRNWPAWISPRHRLGTRTVAPHHRSHPAPSQAGYVASKYTGTLRDCLPCEQRDKCLRTPEKTKVRQVAFFRGKAHGESESACERMKRAIDSETGRQRYGQRFATVRHNKGLNRFTLRGQEKVDGQWKLYCLVHNIEKLANYGFGQ